MQEEYLLPKSIFKFLSHIVGQLFAAENMEMQMLYALATVLAAVGDHAVAICKVFRSGNLGDRFKNAGNISAVFGIYTVGRGNVKLRHHQDMNRCHWVDVAEGVDHLVLVNLGGGNVACNNFTKNTIGHRKFSFLNHRFYRFSIQQKNKKVKSREGRKSE